MQIEIWKQITYNSWDNTSVKITDSLLENETPEEGIQRLLALGSSIKALEELNNKVFKAKIELSDLEKGIKARRYEWDNLATFLRAQGLSNVSLYEPLKAFPQLPPCTEKSEQEEALDEIPFNDESDEEILFEDEPDIVDEDTY